MCFGGDSGVKEAKREAKQAAATEAARQARITQGTQGINDAFGGFDDNFYNDLSGKYVAYAQPQLDKSFTQAKQALTYSLAQTGNLTSSAAAAKLNQLQDEYDQHKQDLLQQAQGYVNNARDTVDNHKTSLMSLLTQTADPAAAADRAAQAAEATAQSATTFNPVAFTFSNLAAGLNNAATSATASRLGNSGVSLYNNNSSAKTVT